MMGHDHSHATSGDADRGKLAIALGLLLAFMVVEVLVGIVVNSLALIADAGHMLTDAAAIAASLVAIRLARRSPKGDYTFGLKRSEILSAQLNGASLFGVGVFITYEGVRRLIEPPEVGGAAILIVALAGVVVNLAATFTLARANRQSLNVEGAFQHILTDLFAFAATAVAGAVVLFSGFARADGIAALFVAVICFRASYTLLRDSGRVLLEAAPKGADPQEIGEAMVAADGIAEVHDLHVWEVTSGFPALAAHVLVGVEEDCHVRRRELERLLDERFGIEHTTLQVDHEQHGELLSLETGEQRAEGLRTAGSPRARRPPDGRG